MKILCVIDSLGSGGAQRQLVGLAKGFKKKGHDVSILVYHHQPFYFQEIKNYNIGYRCINENNYFKRLVRMRRYIRKGKYDGIISFLEAANFITTLSGLPFKKWKLIVGERNANPNILRSFKLNLYRWFHFFTDYVVANSQANIEMVKKINPLLPNKKFKVIYNAVDKNYWKQSNDFIPLRNDKLNIVVAASHQYHKNAKGLIEAVNELSEIEKKLLRIDWYGDLSTDNSYFENVNLIKQFNLEAVIIFHKATKHILKKMQQADAIGLFSFYEGLPNVVCEAMTIGKPVITSSVSDLPQLLKGTNNVLFNPKKKECIQKALRNLIACSSEDLKKTGIQNRKISLNSFDTDNAIESYLDLLS